MRRYIGIAVGFGLLLAVTNATPALAQGAIKPVSALIVNDKANPVPVSVVPESVTTVACTGVIAAGFSSSVGNPFLEGVGSGFNLTSIQCPPGVTVVDVHRILFLPDFSSFSFQTRNLSTWRVYVGYSTDSVLSPPEVMAFLTDGAPEASPTQTFRLDISAPGFFLAKISASSGIAAVPVSITGAVLFSGTPVQ